MAIFNKFQPFAQNVGRGVHNLHTATLKVMLTNTQPLAANGVKADIVEIAVGNGYVAGGNQVANNSYIQTAGVGKLVGDDVIFAASVGSIGPFRWAVLYDDSALNDELIGFWDYGSAQTLAAGEALTVDFNQANGVLQLS